MFIYENQITVIKFLIISIYVILAILLGCSNKSSDYRYQKEDSITQKSKNSEIKPDLSEIEETYDNLNYASVIDQYKKTLPANISITKFRYFIVFSNLSPEITYNVIDKDIRLTIDAIVNNYINVKPDKVTPVFLFEDYDSYKKFSTNTFNMDEQDLSPYGFYKISKNVIVIRYVSWKGSPSHEVTHAMLQNDFPDIPSWFNEGLASLHEKSTYKNGVLEGDFSWRILSIRRAFNENTYTDLETLMNTNDDELYSKKSSFYYAQARYLLMYLQQKGLLKDYYINFRDTYKKDNTGITQLEKITGKKLDEIDKELLDYLNSFKE